MFLLYATIFLFLVLMMIEKLTSLENFFFVIFFYALISLLLLKSSNLQDIFNQSFSRCFHSRLSQTFSTKAPIDFFNQSFDNTCWVCKSFNTTCWKKSQHSWVWIVTNDIGANPWSRYGGLSNLVRGVYLFSFIIPWDIMKMLCLHEEGEGEREGVCDVSHRIGDQVPNAI